MNENPILNSPYEEPEAHYHTNISGELDYDRVRPGRRIFTDDINSIPVKQGPQQQMFEINDLQEEYGENLINLLRKEVKIWRLAGYPNVNRVTKELLYFWFKNPERQAIEKLFFAQQEAIETAVYLNEIAEKSNPGQNILNKLKAAQNAVSPDSGAQLPRIAFKMATGTGKTVVMASLIVYHYFNRQEYKQDTRFADCFLIVAPGITIKDRLDVLFPGDLHKRRGERTDYYAVRHLVPAKYERLLGGLKARLHITNYHAFEPRNLKGNKRSPFDGKISGYDNDGKPIKQVAKENTTSAVKRFTEGKFKFGSRLLILNDEAHHCYLPRSKKKTKDTEGDENAKAAVWFTGLTKLAEKFKLVNVYDLSATPYYLKGSGYPAYNLFGWVVSDFGLIEAIESGLVKIPYLPESDNTHALEMPVLRNLYEHVRHELPKKGQRTKKKEAKAEGKPVTEKAPKLPKDVKTALDQFYAHYKEYSDNMREKGEEQTGLFTRPPVFIAVCNNTSVSKELYKFIAGYEFETILETDDKGKPTETEKHTVTGHYDLFSNYDASGLPKRKPPTLIIDSEALDDSDQISDEFKSVFADKIEEFKREYAKRKGSGAAANITDGQILREIVNTVGEPESLGSHIRCVVSVSMLTEGWDANTVTHIMGLRAFGSQLLCEQVAGRALRRMNYYLQTYSRKTGELIAPKDVKRWKPENIIQKFPPEYAHIIGVPFKMFKGGTTETGPAPDYTAVKALPERQAEHEIEFPNIEGYRVEYEDDELLYDYSETENYEIEGSKTPVRTKLGSAFSEEEINIEVKQVLERREQSLIFLLTQRLMKHHFSDTDGNPFFHKFNQLKEIVTHWYENKLIVLNEDQIYKKLIYFEDDKKVADHINQGINPHINNSEYIKPVFNYYNKFGSTKYVGGNTTKEVFPTEKSHVNCVVMDSDWEGICAKTLEETEAVISYVKNNFLGFAIPYVKDGKDKMYFTDFIAKVKTKDGKTVNLMIEITGMNKDKAEKKWYVENRWLPAANAVKEKYDYEEWHFIEIANDIRDIRNQIINKINSL